ncbi:hypothetical protein POM88_032477 [Heracleum sosnowskyi]|uniref:Uncharacterized protein n=1 Tax=Heracleum sosnowskyi TaxID=360622 RepID=A0AAD8HZD6_9APIA|nr:hypothetical protein POM88_032477 [Heracleum sosnowskyi]
MNSSYDPLHLYFSPSRRRSFENLSFRAYCIHRSALFVFHTRRKRMSKHKKEKARRLWMLKRRKMEMNNLKLYTENIGIIKENEKLRKKAALLHSENLALQSQLQISG